MLQANCRGDARYWSATMQKLVRACNVGAEEEKQHPYLWVEAGFKNNTL